MVMKKVRQGGAMSLLLLGGVLSPSSAELVTTSPPYMIEMDEGVMMLEDEGFSGVEQAPLQDTLESNSLLSEMGIEST